MSERFEPRNELEIQLLEAQEGRISSEDFMRQLMDAQVFLPVRDKYQIANFQASNQAVPLSLKTDDGVEVLILFTSPERAKDFLKGHPGFEGGLLTEFKWVLEKVGVGVGISLNPGWEVGLDLEPAIVEQLTRL